MSHSSLQHILKPLKYLVVAFIVASPGTEKLALPGPSSPLGLTASWTAESDQAGAALGRVASAGDVNGDGYIDAIVGASSYDNGEENEGRAYLYLGSGSGLASTPAWTAESDHIKASFGGSVASAGDVNGDGYSDVIIGASFFDNGETNEGRAYLYLGSALGLASTPAWTAESNQNLAYFGNSVASAGDVNGDGFSDVIVGAHAYDNGQENIGRAYLYQGSASGLISTPAWTAKSDQTAATFGLSVASAGDVNSDGYSDVIVGAPASDIRTNTKSAAYLYLGSATGLASTPAWNATDQVGTYFGGSVASAGDVNNDGYADVIIGSTGFRIGETSYGRASLYLGSVSGLAPTPAWTAEGHKANVLFGLSVASAGDVNGDGNDDVIVGAPNSSIPFTWPGIKGAAYVYLGSASGLASTPAWTVESEQEDRFGINVASAGDVNGDGNDDVFVGAIEFDNGEKDEGGAFLYLSTASQSTMATGWELY